MVATQIYNKSSTQKETKFWAFKIYSQSNLPDNAKRYINIECLPYYAYLLTLYKNMYVGNLIFEI